MSRSSHLESDLRVSHNVCVRGLFGMVSPEDIFGAKIPCFGSGL